MIGEEEAHDGEGFFGWKWRWEEGAIYTRKDGNGLHSLSFFTVGKQGLPSAVVESMCHRVCYYSAVSAAFDCSVGCLT